MDHDRKPAANQGSRLCPDKHAAIPSFILKCNTGGYVRIRRQLARGVLIADAVGCAAAASLVLSNERAVGSFAPSQRARGSVAIALGATSALLVAGAVGKQPTNRDLELAAGVNAGWVTACLLGLLHRPSRTGKVILASTAVLDGAASIAQLTLRSITKT